MNKEKPELDEMDWKDILSEEELEKLRKEFGEGAVIYIPKYERHFTKKDAFKYIKEFTNECKRKTDSNTWEKESHDFNLLSFSKKSRNTK